MASVSLAVVLIATIYVVPIPALRVILALPYLLFFPGYTLVAALFPGKDDIDGIERLGLGLALSIAVVGLTGFALNYTPWGIRLKPILVSLTAFIVLACIAGYYRRGLLPPDKRFALSVNVRLPVWRQMGRFDRILNLALASCIIAATGLLAYAVLRPKIGERFTEFYILGPGGQAEGYATEVSVGEPINLIVGAINREHEDVTYRVVKDVNSQHNEEIAQIRLAHDEEWELPITFTIDEPGAHQKVSFLLYREGHPDPYRSLHLRITVLGGSQHAHGVSRHTVPGQTPVSSP